MDQQLQQYPPTSERVLLQLTPANTQTQAAYHTLNQGDEIQRENITNDMTSGLLIQADLETVIHGDECPGGPAATLIVLSFRFQGINQRRRFREVQITIQFQDEEKPLLYDPEVLSIWPDREYTLNEGTPVTVEETRSIEGGGSGGAGGAAVNATGKWEVKKTAEKVEWATLSGTKTRIGRNYGKKNAVTMSLCENNSERLGVVRDVRAAILLRLHPNTDRFLGHFSINALVDLKYAVQKGLHELLGDRRNDPVIFKKGKQFYNSNGGNAAAREVPGTDLRSINLRQLGDAVSTTTLSTVREDGK